VSLAIDLDAVTRILLPNGWHEIERGTLVIDSYELHHSDPSVSAWPGAWPVRAGMDPDVPTLGFRARRVALKTPSALHGPAMDLAGPITSLLAVEVSGA
jgi:hypothetical protein